MHPFFVVDQADDNQELHQEVLFNKSMCANRLSDHTNADLCTDRKSRLSHDISYSYIVLYIYSYNWPRCKKTFFCQVALVLLRRTRTTAMPCKLAALFSGKPSGAS